MQGEPHYFVYIFGDQTHQNVEIGVAGDLYKLTHTQAVPGPESKTARLVYYEHYSAESDALHRQQQLTRDSRDHAIYLIESVNPNWLDLSDTLDN